MVLLSTVTEFLMHLLNSGLLVSMIYMYHLMLATVHRGFDDCSSISNAACSVVESLWFNYVAPYHLHQTPMPSFQGYSSYVGGLSN